MMSTRSVLSFMAIYMIGLLIFCAHAVFGADAVAPLTGVPDGKSRAAVSAEAKPTGPYPVIAQKPVNFRNPKREYEPVTVQGSTIQTESMTP